MLSVNGYRRAWAKHNARHSITAPGPRQRCPRPPATQSRPPATPPSIIPAKAGIQKLLTSPPCNLPFIRLKCTYVRQSATGNPRNSRRHRPGPAQGPGNRRNTSATGGPQLNRILRGSGYHGLTAAGSSHGIKSVLLQAGVALGRSTYRHGSDQYGGCHHRSARVAGCAFGVSPCSLSPCGRGLG